MRTRIRDFDRCAPWLFTWTSERKFGATCVENLQSIARVSKRSFTRVIDAYSDQSPEPSPQQPFRRQLARAIARGNRIPPVAAKRSIANPHPRRCLPALVL